jgi:hypothetical protein
MEIPYICCVTYEVKFTKKQTTKMIKHAHLILFILNSIMIFSCPSGIGLLQDDLGWEDLVEVEAVPIPFRALEWEIPDFAYTEYLSFEVHSNSVRSSLHGIYTHRHLWNHMCIFRQVMPSTPQFVHFETALDVLSHHYKMDRGKDMRIDQSCLSNFHLLMSQILDPLLSQPTTQYWNNRDEYPTLMHVYDHEVQLWGDSISTNTNMHCVLTLIARNYLIVIMTFLMFIETFDNQSLKQEAEAMYAQLTDYTHCFEQCSTFNLYANVLAHVDALFVQLQH